MKFKSVTLKKVVKLTVLVLCLTGFTLQTLEHLQLYWTYPTVMDIQEYIPTEIDLPGISFCNNNGVIPKNICKRKILCIPYFIVKSYRICDKFPTVCDIDSLLLEDFTLVPYNSFAKMQDIDVTTMDDIKIPVKEFLKCKFVQGDREFECNMDDIITGSYYSDSEFFNVCYTINSLWGNPKRKIKKIGKYDKIVLDFFIDMSHRGRADSPEAMLKPKYNLISSTASIELVVHSPYITVNPHVSGFGFLGGKQYQVKLKMEEKHLLPPPYQTNCTDYRPSWIKRGGIAPLNEVMAVEECKYNKTLQLMGCVPFIVNYPHNQTVCKYSSEYPGMADIIDECSKVLEVYRQPCDFTTYDMDVVEKTTFITNVIENVETGKNESLVFTRKGHDCSTPIKLRYQKCHEIKIELVFDDFLVKNLTYNPKIEDLQLLSVIGGYMGIYLGISFATTYDLCEWILLRYFWYIYVNLKKKQKKKNRKNRVFMENGIEPSSEGNFRRRKRNPAMKEVY